MKNIKIYLLMATARIRCTVEQILTTMKHCTGTLLFQKGGD